MMGNCGVVRARAARRARVADRAHGGRRGHPGAALSAGIRWDWEASRSTSTRSIACRAWVDVGAQVRTARSRVRHGRARRGERARDCGTSRRWSGSCASARRGRARLSTSRTNGHGRRRTSVPGTFRPRETNSRASAARSAGGRARRLRGPQAGVGAHGGRSARCGRGRGRVDRRAFRAMKRPGELPFCASDGRARPVVDWVFASSADGGRRPVAPSSSSAGRRAPVGCTAGSSRRGTPLSRYGHLSRAGRASRFRGERCGLRDRSPSRDPRGASRRESPRRARSRRCSVPR